MRQGDHRGPRRAVIVEDAEERGAETGNLGAIAPSAGRPDRFPERRAPAFAAYR
jgi:hypothetical protein